MYGFRRDRTYRLHSQACTAFWHKYMLLVHLLMIRTRMRTIAWVELNYLVIFLKAIYSND